MTNITNYETFKETIIRRLNEESELKYAITSIRAICDRAEELTTKSNGDNTE